MLFLLPLASRAQDPVFSQYFNQKLYLNPAFTGYEPGLVFSSGFRNQWRSVANGQGRYLTNHVELSQELASATSGNSGVGIGISYTDNAEGEGLYNALGSNTGLLRWQRSTVSFGWHNWACNIDDSPIGISLGFEGAHNRYVMDWQNFTFGDQLDPIYGTVRNTNVPIPDGGISGTTFYDVSAGGIIHFNQDRHRLYRLGFAAHHIVLQNNSPNGFDDRLPMRFTLHGTGILHRYDKGAIQNLWQFNPTFRVDLQQAASGISARQNGQVSPFWHALFSTGFAVKTPGLTRLTAGAWYQGSTPLNVSPAYRQGIHSVQFYGALEQIQQPRSGYAGFTYELGFSWNHNLGAARSLGDIFEFSLTINLPSTAALGFGCQNCMIRHVINQF